MACSCQGTKHVKGSMKATSSVGPAGFGNKLTVSKKTSKKSTRVTVKRK